MELWCILRLEAIVSLLDQLPQAYLSSPHVIGGRPCHIDFTVNTMMTMPLDQLVILLSLLKDANPAEMLEIGTFTGFTTKFLADAMPNTVVHTLELPPEFDGQGGLEKSDNDYIVAGRHFIGQAFRDDPKNIIQHFGDSATFDFSTIGHPTFCFIDGSHTYDYVMNDTRKFRSICPHGSIVWHDVAEGHDEVVRALIDLRGEGLDIYRIGYGVAWCRI